MKNHTQNLLEKLFPGPFLKNRNCAYVWINSLKFNTVVFVVCQVGSYRKMLKISCRPLAFTSYKAFLKCKKGLELASLPHFLHDFWRNTYLVIFYSLAKFHRLVAFTSWDIGQYVYCNCLLTRLWRHAFWNQPYISNQAVFSAWPKSQDKNLNTLRTKGASKDKVMQII